jgi:pyoverdine/dityrosine biosynthesis protein Dit1
MQNAHVADGHSFPDEVDVELDVFCAFVMHWILAHVNRRHVVTVDDCGLLDVVAKLGEEMTKP